MQNYKKILEHLAPPKHLLLPVILLLRDVIEKSQNAGPLGSVEHVIHSVVGGAERGVRVGGLGRRHGGQGVIVH